MADLCMFEVAFQEPASTTHFGKLPEELNTKIFDFAFGERSRDVAKCRLSCQHLFALCSPYLIRTAVVAKRRKTRQKLQEVMHHPYFHKHVTHFLWDASKLGEDTANDVKEYIEMYSKDLHLKRYAATPSHMVQSNRDDRVMYIKGHGRYRANEPWDALLRSRSGFDAPIDEAQVAEFSMEERPDMSCNPLGFYNVGIYHGQRQYAAYLRAQEQLINSGWLFLKALRVFKSLTHLSFSDFRALAYPDESYVDLCQQLFGDVACPKFSVHGSAEDFLHFLRNPKRGSWKSISIGHHPFLSNAFDEIQEGESRDWHHRLGHHALNEILSTEELRLSVSSTGWKDKSMRCAHWGFGINVMSKLRGLELNFDDLGFDEALGRGNAYEPVITFDRVMYNSWHDQWRAGVYPHLLFRDLLSAKGQDFTSLKVLTLRNFTFEQATMQDFLISLKKLHILHLIDCLSLGSYDGFFTMARTALSSSLRLIGVEIYGLRFLECDHQAEPRPAFDPELREKARIKRSLDYDLATACGLVPEFYPFTVRDWPCECPELEDAILNGRSNNVTRKARAAPNQETKEGWANIAVRDL